MLQFVIKIIFISSILLGIFYGSFGKLVRKKVSYSFGVKGQLFCKRQRYGGAQIELSDYYKYKFNQLGFTKSNKDGNFSIRVTRQTGDFHLPNLQIKHKCSSEHGCTFSFHKSIPKKYIFKRQTAHPYYDLGKINLNKEDYKYNQFNCNNK